jgi:hypothetical protein
MTPSSTSRRHPAVPPIATAAPVDGIALFLAGPYKPNLPQPTNYLETVHHEETWIS